MKVRNVTAAGTYWPLGYGPMLEGSILYPVAGSVVQNNESVTIGTDSITHRHIVPASHVTREPTCTDRATAGPNRHTLPTTH